MTTGVHLHHITHRRKADTKSTRKVLKSSTWARFTFQRRADAGASAMVSITTRFRGGPAHARVLDFTGGKLS